MLALGVIAPVSAFVFCYGLPFLLPEFQREFKLNLAQAGTVVAAPTIGLTVSLLLWGFAADKFGERGLITVGLGLNGIAVLAAAMVHPGLVGLLVFFGIGGACGASVNTSSGRLVMGWFPKHERGLAMGIRQTCQPLGVAIAAVALPTVAKHYGIMWALLVPGALCVLSAAAVAIWAVDPPRESKEIQALQGNPYRTSTLPRLHVAAAFLVVPQFAISAFSLAYLVSQQNWAAATAGFVLAAFQVLGAFARIGSGIWSDKVGSRLGPMRALAVASCVTMLFLAAATEFSPWLALVGLALGAIITVADNGLAFTATAELAGMSWSGRALGVHSTGQNLSASITPPLLGAVIGASSYSIGFVVAAVFPLLAIMLVPVRAESHAGNDLPAEYVGAGEKS
jgi:sugar phosphate permease